MRTQSLRQFANRQIKQDRQGKYLYRKHRAYVIHKMIDDLFVIRQAPPSWQSLQSEQVHKLVRYWKKQNINPVTIMRYMTIIRRFLQLIINPLNSQDLKQEKEEGNNPSRYLEVTSRSYSQGNHGITNRVWTHLQRSDSDSTTYSSQRTLSLDNPRYCF